MFLRLCTAYQVNVGTHTILCFLHLSFDHLMFCILPVEMLLCSVRKIKLEHDQKNLCRHLESADRDPARHLQNHIRVGSTHNSCISLVLIIYRRVGNFSVKTLRTYKVMKKRIHKNVFISVVDILFCYKK